MGFRLVAALGIPLLFLALLEAGLRLIGYGFSTALFIPHAAVGPGALVENQRFSWRFAPPTLARNPEPIVLPRDKPESTCRIFVFGESAAIGDPAPAFGFSRILGVLLRARHPGIEFEMVNTAFTAINSHVIRSIARDCRHRRGDIWLVYMGNNEVIGPYGAGTVFGRQTPPLPLIQASLAVKTTRTGQWLDSLLRTVRSPGEAALGWGGMSMFLDQQVRRDDPRLAEVGETFTRNLESIIRTGRDAGARLVVSTMVSRLRDWPPFGSLHRPGLSEAERIEWERLYQAGLEAEAGGDWATAVRNYDTAARIDEGHAELQFRWGRCLLAGGQEPEARTHLTLARDLDTLRFRTDSRLNALLRQTVRRHASSGVRLLEAEEAFARNSTNGLPGQEYFHEHVHFTFAGNYLLARLFADEIEALLPKARTAHPATPTPWLSSDDCAARLGYTDSQRYEIAQLIRRRFDEPIYRQQAGHAERLQRLDQDLAELRSSAKPLGRRRALMACRQASSGSPQDWVLRDLTARLLSGLDELDAASAEWREVARLIPHAARPHSEIGKIYQQQGKTDDALAAFTEALALNPDWVDAHLGLASLYKARGAQAQAMRHYRRALSLDPTRSEAADALKRGSGPGPNP